jgi:tetratricopeptide (TPR) repeat protein
MFAGMNARRCLSLLLILSALFAAGCGRKEITSLQRKEAANLFSEAQFALTLRDYARAEPLLTKVTTLCPDTPEYWQSLGAVRRRLDNRSGAKQAYEQMRDAARDQYKQDDKKTEALLQQVYALALLGQADDARSLLAKAQKNHPDDRALGAFADGKQLDRILADPAFKEIAL